MNANTNERNIKCCSCFEITEDYYFIAKSMCVIGCGSGIETWCKNCEDDLRENEADKIVRNIEQVDICKGCNCDIDDNGKCGKECRFADYCGVWDCGKCKFKNTDTETCFKCGYLGNEMDDNEGEEDEEAEEKVDNVCECCGEFHDVGLATGENGIEMLVCENCDIDGSNYNGWGDETEYMNELIECVKCEKDVKRKNMAWGMGGCYYHDVCKKCDVAK